MPLEKDRLTMKSIAVPAVRCSPRSSGSHESRVFMVDGSVEKPVPGAVFQEEFQSCTTEESAEEVRKEVPAGGASWTSVSSSFCGAVK